MVTKMKRNDWVNIYVAKAKMFIKTKFRDIAGAY